MADTSAKHQILLSEIQSILEWCEDDEQNMRNYRDDLVRRALRPRHPMERFQVMRRLLQDDDLLFCFRNGMESGHVEDLRMSHLGVYFRFWWALCCYLCLEWQSYREGLARRQDRSLALVLSAAWLCVGIAARLAVAGVIHAGRFDGAADQVGTAMQQIHRLVELSRPVVPLKLSPNA